MAPGLDHAWYVATTGEREEILRDGIAPMPKWIADTVQLFESHGDALEWARIPHTFGSIADIWRVDLHGVAVEVEDRSDLGPDVSLVEPIVIPPARLDLHDQLEP